MIRRFLVVGALLVPAVAGMVLPAHPAAAPADPPATFAQDVAPILYRKCVSCHRPGEAAPMSLLSYTDARPYARAIKDKVMARQMPPWFADPGVGEFANDPRLTDKEIATIASWTDGGSPQGDASKMPPAPKFTEGWQLGEPDYVVNLPEVKIPATGPDIFPTPSISVGTMGTMGGVGAVGAGTDRWIRAIEIRPSNRDVAHHAVIFSTSVNLMSGVPVNADGLFDVLGVWAVGTPATVYPDGEGRWIRKGQTLRTNLHYHPNGTEQTDRIRVGFYFGKGDLKKEVAAGLLGNLALTIPPNAANHEIRSTFVVDQDVTLVSLFPHMHLRGKDMTITAFLPGGHEKTLLRVPSYDFNWQLFYYPKTSVKLPRGTRLELVSHYDNSAGNKRNPNPSATVRFGESSNDEMNFGMYEFTADAGVSPAPSTDRTHMDALAMSFEPGTALRVDVPFVANRPSPFVFYVPKSGEARNYIATQGARIGVAAIQNLAWNGNAFQFQTGVLGVPGGNGQFDVSGTVDASGAVHGKMERRVPANSGTFELTGAINK